MTPLNLSVFAKFRSLIATNTPLAVKTTAGKVRALHITNRHSATIFVKLYNAATAGTTVGTTAPQNIVQVPANSQVLLRFGEQPLAFSTAITLAVTTGVTDADATAAATLPIIELEYE